MVKQAIKNNSNNKQQKKQNMEPKTRPFSHKPISTIPIIIDQTPSIPDNHYKAIQISTTHLHPKLSHIVPELPQFGIKSNSTALLYSKFVVKGLKEDKLSVVRSAFRKKEECTEAGTVCQNRNKSIKSTTKLKTGEMLDCVPVEDEVNHSIFDGERKDGDFSGLLRASSAKVFRKTSNKDFFGIYERNERTLSKNHTEVNLQPHKQTKRRPTTAKPIRSKDTRFSHGCTVEDESKPEIREARKQRPTTASVTKNNFMEKSLFFGDQINNLIANKIMKDKPLKVEALKGIDHIERNIQNISSYNRKTSSIYLTNANLEQLINKKQETKPNQPKKEQEKKSVAAEFEPQPQQLFTKTDKANQEKKLRKIEAYLEQALPTKFQLVSQQLRKEHRNNTEISQNYQQLLSKSLDNRESQDNSDLNDRSAKACFEDYIQNCQILQYNISSKMKTEQSNAGGAGTLNICQCQRIIEIYKGMLDEKCQQKRLTMISQIRELTKNLKYFSYKPKPQVDKFFTIPFQIIIADEAHTMIELNSPVNFIYIILNGSVLVEYNSQNENDMTAMMMNFGRIEDRLFNSQYSLYDGEIFGEPAKPSQRFYKMRVTTLEQSLLLKIKYENYISKFFEGSEVEEKLEVLRLAFKMEMNRDLLKDEDLQILSLSLQKHRFPSKSLIFRQGEVFDKLILVSKGKVAGINQFILEQDRIQSVDMKQLDKKVRQQKQNSKSKKFIQNDTKIADSHLQLDVDKLSIQKMRRQNLINYEILRQDNKKQYYYFMKHQCEYVRGDTLNWQPLFASFATPVAQNSIEEALNAIFQFGLTKSLEPVKFSLMSNADDTEIYLLSRQAFQYLPSNIKKVMLAKGGQMKSTPLKVFSQKQIKQWNNYKQKLCNDIVKDRKERSSRKRL